MNRRDCIRCKVEMEIGFVAIKPGRYFLEVPGSTGDTQRLEIVIE